MPAAACLIRPLPHYRREVFEQGLRQAGYDLASSPAALKPGDVLVIWNRYGPHAAWADKFEAAGGRVLVVENGWLGEGKHFAIALSQHNGAGSWAIGSDDRWLALNIALKPWRARGNHILVLPQRGIGPLGVAMPPGWAAGVCGRLTKATDRPIKVRRHPGKEPHPPLEPDLEDCWAAVTWGSGAAIHAIIAGIPVFHELQNWVGAPAARLGIAQIEQPFLGDRRPMLRRLAWHQWAAEEVRTGEPFRWLLKS